jgi:hypothetical protein
MAVTTEELQQIFQKIAAELVERLATQTTKSTASEKAGQQSTSLGKPSDMISGEQDQEEFATAQVQQPTSDPDLTSDNSARIDEAKAGGVTQDEWTETRREEPSGGFADRQPEEQPRRVGDQQDAGRRSGRKVNSANGAVILRDRAAGVRAPSVEFREPTNRMNPATLAGIQERLITIDKLSNELRELQARVRQFGRGYDQTADLITEHQPSAQNFGGRP